MSCTTMNGDGVLHDGVVQNVCKQRGACTSNVHQVHLKNSKRSCCCCVSKVDCKLCHNGDEKSKGLDIACIGQKIRISQSVYVVGLIVIGGVYLLLSRSDCSSIGGKGVPVLGTFMVRILDICGLFFMPRISFKEIKRFQI